ncbi:Tetracycline resistance protein, putative, major facilitator superfamily [Thermococcus gammatolerans EJ3]|uniref:Tetracycline resistance protein, putative, major facilitator superfamily n=2 Tax=Thermococcus TaxID=2263 RepID=C5A6T3_THEGJ|nr:Tetracycline resistance protein, putative, major facilitator superfamily [Thermococcus gammatolerans EJ3]
MIEMTEDGSKTEKKVFGISWNVFVLGLVSFLNDMSSEMINPVIPKYLTDVLGTGELLSGTLMGAIESLSSLFKVAFGYFSDRFKKRKAFIFAGYALSTFAKGALAFTRHWWDFLSLRVLDRVGKGIRTAPRDALIAESSEKGKTGKSFGFHRMMDTLGAVAGPLVGIGLLHLMRGIEIGRAYRYLFLSAAVPGLLSLLIIVFLVKDRGREVKKKITGVSALKSRSLRLFLLVIAVGALGRYSYAFTLWKAGELGYSLKGEMAFYALFNLMYALAAYPIGVYSDRVGKKTLITAGFLISALASLAFAYARGLGTLILAFVLYGIYIAIEDTVPRAYMADLAKDFEKGTVIGAYHTVFGVFVFPASVIAGWLWQSYSLTYSFLYAAFMNLLAFVLMILIRDHR